MINTNPIHNSNKKLYGIDLYLDLIKEWVTSRGFTPHGLAKAAKFGPGTFADMYTTRWNPRASTLRELEGFMIRYDEIHIDKKSVEYYYSKSDNSYETRLDIGIYAIKHFLYQTLRTSIINQRLILSK